MDKFPPSGRFWDRTKKLLLTALPDSGGERKGSALLLGHLLATNCSAWVTWRPLTTCGHHLCTPPPRKGPRAGRAVGRAPGGTSALRAPLVSSHVWKAAPRSSCCCAERRQAVPPGPHRAEAPGPEPGPSRPTSPSGILAHSMPSGELCSPSPANRCFHSFPPGTSTALCHPQD